MTARTGAPAGLAQYLEKETIAAFMVGVSSGFPFAMIAATLTTRLAEAGIEKKTVTAFTLAFLVYNFKWIWAWIVDGVRLPVIGRLGQRVSWMLVTGVLVMAAVTNLALVDPQTNIWGTVVAAVLVGAAGATFDIVIDAYRIETLRPDQLGAGSGMSQYGWRVGSAASGAVALLVANAYGWQAGYLACALFALPAMMTALWLGEPARHVVTQTKRGLGEVWASIAGPFVEFLSRKGAIVVLIFILVHKIGDTLGQLSLRLMLNDLGFTKPEVAYWDVGLGFIAYLVGIFVGGWAYGAWGMKRSVLVALVMMAVSNLSFAGLAVAGHSIPVLAGAMCFENFASGFGGVVVVAYFSALCDLRFTGAQYALISAASSIVGRLIQGTQVGGFIEANGYVTFYALTFLIALPGVIIYLWMMRTGLVDEAIGTAGVTPAPDHLPPAPSLPDRAIPR